MSLDQSKGAWIESKMGLIEPERTKETLNIFKMILYELKMSLSELKWISLWMRWEEPKWPQMSLNELKF